MKMHVVVGAVALLLCGVSATGSAEVKWQAQRKTFLRGEQAEVTLEGPAEEMKDLRVQLRGLNVPGSWALKIAEGGKLSIDTGLYRVGDYEVILQKGATVLGKAELYIRPAERPEMWFGNFTGRPPWAGGEPYRELQDLGMNAAYLYSTQPDESLRYGVYLVYHGNALRGAEAGLPKEEQEKLRGVFRNCKGQTKPSSGFCMRNPQVIQRAADKAVEEIKGLVAYPGFLGIGVDDEVSMRGYDWNDTGGVTCFCDSCRKLWKEKAGQEPPTPPCLKPGTVIPDDDPYLRYMIEWTGEADYYGPAEAAYNRALADRLHGLRKDLLVFQTPGALYGEMDVVHWEIYDYWFSSPATGALSAMSFCRAAQRKELAAPKPIWPLIGWFQHVPQPPWAGDFIQAQSKMCLAEGADAIWLTLMSWYDSYGHHKREILSGTENLRPSVMAVADLLERFGPALRRVKPVRYPVGVLVSGTTEGYQRIIDPEEIAKAKARGSWLEVPWEHGQSTGMGFAALLRAGVPAELVTEDDVLAGRLDGYGALVLLDHKYARRSVVDRINAYAEKGRLVLADKSSLIRPEKATVLPFDASQFTQMINLGLRAARVPGDRLEIVHRRTAGLEKEWALLAREFLDGKLPEDLRIVRSDSADIIVRIGRSGDTDYVFVLSADVFGEQSATVSARTRGRFAYDLFAGDTVVLAAPDGVLKLRAVIPPGGWQVYAVTQNPLAGVALEATVAADVVTAKATVRDSEGKAVNGSFPLQLVVTGPKGEALPYGGYFGTDGGTLTRQFRVALNDPDGEWQIRAINLTTGQSADAKVTVKR